MGTLHHIFFSRRNTDRTEYIHEGFWATKERKKELVPHDIQLTKGSVHVAVSRDFVDFVLHNKIAIDFRDWVKNTGVPDETFFTSLNHSPHLGVPGAYKGSSLNYIWRRNLHILYNLTTQKGNFTCYYVLLDIYLYDI